MDKLIFTLIHFFCALSWLLSFGAVYASDDIGIDDDDDDDDRYITISLSSVLPVCVCVYVSVLDNSSAAGLIRKIHVICVF